MGRHHWHQGLRLLFGGPMEPGSQPAPAGFRWVFCKSYTHPKTRRRIYAKTGKCFAFLVRE